MSTTDDRLGMGEKEPGLTRAPSQHRRWSLWGLTPLAFLVLAGCAFTISWSIGDPCRDSEFTCITLEVPLDHFDPGEERTIEVTFAVLAASGPSDGAYVVAVGGPGESGVAVADLVLLTLDPEIRERFDIVVFDHRGLAMSEELACPQTDADPDLYPNELPEDPAEQWAELVGLTSRAIASCIAEMGDPEILAYLGTAQAAADLETFRVAQGYDRLVLHGESYGTVLVQTYAASHPEAVERMVLDGTIDLTLDELAFAQTQVEAFDRILGMVLGECDRDRDCAEDMGMPAGDAYRTLERRLADSSIDVPFPIGGGEWEEFPFYSEDLWYLAYSSLYTEEGRMLFLRALAAYSSRGDLASMSRLYASDPGAELSWVFHTAVTCRDASLPGNTVDEALQAVAAAWEAAPDPSHRWFYTAALTCVFWPHFDQARTPAKPLLAQGIPTLVLATDADPATPYSHAKAVAARLDQGHLLTQVGGPHVIFGWGNPCVDAAVTRFVLDAEIPRPASCPGSLLSPYLPLLSPAVTDLPTRRCWPSSTWRSSTSPSWRPGTGSRRLCWAVLTEGTSPSPQTSTPPGSTSTAVGLPRGSCSPGRGSGTTRRDPPNSASPWKGPDAATDGKRAGRTEPSPWTRTADLPRAPGRSTRPSNQI